MLGEGIGPVQRDSIFDRVVAAVPIEDSVSSLPELGERWLEEPE
jgi:hypothetical protein